MDNDISVVEIVRPMGAERLQREITNRQSERGAEIEELEAKLAQQDELGQGQDQDAGWQERLEHLQSINGTQDAHDVLSENTITIALRSVTRRQAFQRGQFQMQAREWLMDEAGVESYDDVNMEAVGDEIGEVWMAMYQAADIIPALVVEQCKGWQIPDKLEEWADVHDFIFSRALGESWALNPQFALSQLDLG